MTSLHKISQGKVLDVFIFDFTILASLGSTDEEEISFCLCITLTFTCPSICLFINYKLPLCPSLFTLGTNATIWLALPASASPGVFAFTEIKHCYFDDFSILLVIIQLPFYSFDFLIFFVRSKPVSCNLSTSKFLGT